MPTRTGPCPHSPQRPPRPKARAVTHFRTPSHPPSLPPPTPRIPPPHQTSSPRAASPPATSSPSAATSRTASPTCARLFTTAPSRSRAPRSMCGTTTATCSVSGARALAQRVGSRVVVEPLATHSRPLAPPPSSTPRARRRADWTTAGEWGVRTAWVWSRDLGAPCGPGSSIKPPHPRLPAPPPPALRHTPPLCRRQPVPRRVRGCAQRIYGDLQQLRCRDHVARGHVRQARRLPVGAPRPRFACAHAQARTRAYASRARAIAMHAWRALQPQGGP